MMEQNERRGCLAALGYWLTRWSQRPKLRQTERPDPISWRRWRR